MATKAKYCTCLTAILNIVFIDTLMSHSFWKVTLLKFIFFRWEEILAIRDEIMYSTDIEIWTHKVGQNWRIIFVLYFIEFACKFALRNTRVKKVRYKSLNFIPTFYSMNYIFNVTDLKKKKKKTHILKI